MASDICTLSIRRPIWTAQRPKPIKPKLKLRKAADAAVDMKSAQILRFSLYLNHQPKKRLSPNQAAAAVVSRTENDW